MAKQKQNNPLAAAKYDPVTFIETVTIDPETDRPPVVYKEEGILARRVHPQT